MTYQQEQEKNQKMIGSKLGIAQSELAGFKGVEINGKTYLPVKARLELFRSHFPDYSLTTEIVKYGDKISDGICIKATIMDGSGREVASGHAESIRGDGKYASSAPVEFTETKACGRALAVFGLGGGEFASADELTAVAVPGGPSGTESDKSESYILPPPSNIESRISPAKMPTIDLDDDVGNEILSGQPDLEMGESGNHGGNRAWAEVGRALIVGLKLQENLEELKSYYGSNQQLIDEMKHKSHHDYQNLMEAFSNRKAELRKGDIEL